MVKRILIADDYEAILRGLRASLEANQEWKICGDALDGQEAIAKAAQLRPDLRILDLVMPRLDGLNAAKKIASPDVPIVLYALDASSELDRAANEYGVRRL